MSFTHLNKDGEAVMVDVGGKAVTERTAIASATVAMKEDTLKGIIDISLKKGDVLAVSRVAGIMGGKKTHELIPLCHNIPVDKIEIDFTDNGKDELYITARAKCTYKTGIEMEALTSATVAALTVYDMCKAVDRSMVIKEIKLIEKTGGKSDYKYEG